MKITCQSCGAKYAISDDKVRGRRVKVRCKSCRTAIVVDGYSADADAEAAALGSMAGSDDDEATRVHQTSTSDANAAASADMWSVNLSDTDQRDMTTSEIVSGWNSGLVTQDAYVWREGMDDWAGILDVPELASQLSMPGQSAAGFDTGGAPPWSAEPAAAPAAAFSFGASAPTAGEAARIEGGRAQPGADLFGSAASAGSEEEAVYAPAAGQGAYAPAEEKPTGARNENSVLFSLDALKAGFSPTAQKGPAPAAAPRKAQQSAEKANLDDIMNMGGGGGSNALFGLGQNDALLTAPAPPPPPPPRPVLPSDPGLGAAASIAPGVMSTGAPGGNKKLILAVGGGLAVLLIVAIVIGAVAVSGGKDEDKVAKNDSAQDKSSASGKDDKKSDDKKADDTSDDTSDDKKNDTAAAADSAKPDDSAKGEDGKPVTEEEKKRFAEAMKKKEEEAKKDDKTADKKEEVAKKEEPSSGVASFNKGAAISALSSAAAAASGCKRPGGPTGSGRAIVTFAPSGRATSANVTGGSFGGTSVGGCVASVFRRAHVPPFSGNSVTVSKSFTIAP